MLPCKFIGSEYDCFSHGTLASDKYLTLVRFEIFVGGINRTTILPFLAVNFRVAPEVREIQSNLLSYQGIHPDILYT